MLLHDQVHVQRNDKRGVPKITCQIVISSFYRHVFFPLGKLGRDEG